MAHGKGWLEEHPHRDLIVQRYLGHRKEPHDRGDVHARSRAGARGGNRGRHRRPRRRPRGEPPEPPEEIERRKNLHEQRLDWVENTLRETGAERVVDLGCGEGRLLRRLLGEPRYREIVGADVSARSLEIARRRLGMRKMKAADRDRISLLQTSLVYRDSRLAGFDAVTLVEVIEHVEPERLDLFQRNLFDNLQPGAVILTTPNREYNVRFENMRANGLRHRDHRFEWTRAEFETWAREAAETHGYTVETGGVGPEDPEVGPPSQTARFTRCSR